MLDGALLTSSGANRLFQPLEVHKLPVRELADIMEGLCYCGYPPSLACSVSFHNFF